MKTKRICGGWVVAFMVLAWAQGASAGNLPPRETLKKVQSHLAAGEIAAAKELAHQTDAALKDALLSHIVVAQARLGLRASAIDTAAQIADDSLRGHALRQMDDGAASNASASGADGGASDRRPAFPGAAGGGVVADFDSLIQLITSTVDPDSWTDGGGEGAITPFPTGILIDAAGTIRRDLAQDQTGRVAAARRRAAQPAPGANVRRTSQMRMVSLPRLEQEIELRLAAGKPLDQEMLYLAGITRILHVFVYPETGDLVIAGPAGDWQPDSSGRICNAEDGHPVMQLNDLVVLLRHMHTHANGQLGCAIRPTEQGLAKAAEFLQTAAQKPNPKGANARWLESLRSAVGQQVVSVDGVHPATRVGQVLVEADYHMKLIGIGLEPGTVDVPSYLDLVAREETTPPIEVLRWWFTLHYDSIKTDPEGNAFSIAGPGAQVLSENEFLTEQGQRVHTGEAEPINRAFAANFSKFLPDLAKKYHVYGDLQNVCDLSLVCALVHEHDLAAKTGWTARFFLDPARYEVPTAQPILAVDTVANTRRIRGKEILSVVSGGVTLDPLTLVLNDVEQDKRLSSQRSQGTPPASLETRHWWWD